MTIPFTQYLLPNGRKQQIKIERPADIEKIAHAFIASGGRYEAEILTTGQISLTAVKKVRGEEGDVAIVVGPNKPGENMLLVDRLVHESAGYIEVAA